jgi:hypothetical protein
MSDRSLPLLFSGARLPCGQSLGRRLRTTCCGCLPAGLCARLVVAVAPVAWGAPAAWGALAAPTGCAWWWPRRWHSGGSWGGVVDSGARGCTSSCSAVFLAAALWWRAFLLPHLLFSLLRSSIYPLLPPLSLPTSSLLTLQTVAPDPAPAVAHRCCSGAVPQLEQLCSSSPPSPVLGLQDDFGKDQGLLCKKTATRTIQTVQAPDSTARSCVRRGHVARPRYWPSFVGKYV